MEQILHYVWKYKLYAPTELETADGLQVEVIDPGTSNSDAGPDFFNAKVRISDTIWAGSVEIHDKASDWMRHGHNTDKTYDAVILHIVGEDDADIFRSNGELIPQVVLPVPAHIRRNINWLVSRDVPIACLPSINSLPSSLLTSWKNALLGERLSRKTNDIFQMLEQYDNDWNEVFYITLTRSFGFGVNSDAFEQLAKSLPFQYILKQRTGSTQVEAMFFGQAGMLEEDSDEAYYKFIQQEYAFLSHKYGLKPLDASIFKSLRMRPGGFPALRIAQLAALWVQHDDLLSHILEEDNIESLKKMLNPQLSPFWDRRYNLRNKSSVNRKKQLGESAQNIILINSVVPVLFAYAQRHQRPELAERAISILESLPSEENAVVRIFRKAGFRAENAGDSQSLIQLKREYCEKKKCMYCRIGFQLLKRRNELAKNPYLCNNKTEKF